MAEFCEIFYVADVGIRRWNEQNGVCVKEMEQEGHFNVIALTSDLTKLVCTQITKIIIYDVDTGEKSKFSECHLESIRCLVISPDDLTIASCSGEDDLKVWDLSTRTLKMTLGSGLWDRHHVLSVAITSRTGGKIASGSIDNTVRIFSLVSGRLLFTLKGHADCVQHVIFTPDGQQVISGSFDGSIRVWNVENGGHVSTINVESGVVSVAITSSGDKLVCNTYDKFVRAYNLHTKQPIWRIDNDIVSYMKIAISPDDQHVISGPLYRYLFKWSLVSGERVKNLTDTYCDGFSFQIVCCQSVLFSDNSIELKFSGRIIDTSLKKIIYKVNMQTRVETNDNLVSIYEEELLVANIKASNTTSALQFKSWIYAVKHHIGSPIEQRAKTGNQIMNRYKADWLQTMNILKQGRVNFLPKNVANLIKYHICK